MSRRDIKDARRSQLIEATIESIARHGFAETTLADVAAAAGLSQGIVGFYFKTKNDLLIATLRHIMAAYEARSAAAQARAGSAPADQLAAMVAADFDASAGSRKTVTVWYAFWGETRWRPEFLRLCEERARTYQEHTSTAVQRVVDAGGYADRDANTIARGLNAMIDGLWLNILIDPKNCSRETALRTCRAYLAQYFPREFGAGNGVASAA